MDGEVSSGVTDLWPARVRSWESLRDAIASTADSRARIHLDVIRHGETVLNHAGRISGRAETDLTERGRAQAALVGREFREPYDVTFDSGLRRSIDTLSIALSESSTTARLTFRDPRLAERSMGVLEGEPSRPIPEYDRGDFGWAPPGGEPYISVAQRILSFLLDLSDYGQATGRNLRALASTHVGPMRILTSIVEEVSDPAAALTRQFPNTALWTGEVRSITWPRFLPLD